MRAWAILACSLVLAGCRMFSGVRLEDDFRKDPQTSGWAYVSPGADQRPKGSWITGDSGPEACFVVAAAGHWESRPIPVEPLQYYKLTFKSKADGKSYWAAIFFDADGNRLDADHYSSVDATENWVARAFCFRARAKAATVRIWFEPRHGKAVRVTDVKLAEVSRKKAAEWADAVLATIPPLTYQPPPGRWEHMPRTMEKLRRGETVRIVVLGDSIACDTGNSTFDVLLERMYPSARIEVITSTRGGTGCGYYRQEGCVKAWVTDYKPDLLIIAGISHGRNPEAIRSVIEQARWGIGLEVMIAAGPPRLEWLARDQSAEFLDMWQTWWAYVDNSGLGRNFFLRDGLHPNARGKQVLGRTLQRYFAPPEDMGPSDKAFYLITDGIVGGASGSYSGCMRALTPAAWR